MEQIKLFPEEKPVERRLEVRAMEWAASVVRVARQFPHPEWFVNRIARICGESARRGDILERAKVKALATAWGAE